MKHLAAALALFLTALGAEAFPDPQNTKSKSPAAKAGPPTTPPPRFFTVKALKKSADHLEFTELVTSPVWEERQETKEKDGKPVVVTVKVQKQIATTKVLQVKVAAGQLFDGLGQAVKPAEAWKRLEVGSVVLVSSDGQKVHPAYRKLIRKETLILVLPLPEDIPHAPTPTPRKPASKQPKAAIAAAR